MNFVCKGTFYLTGAFVGGCLVSDTFAKKVDRNLVSPIRNYRFTLENANYWRTSEDLNNFRKDITKGIKRMFEYEDDI